MLLFYDFYYFYAAGRLASRGENPYDLTRFAAEMHAVGWPATEHPDGCFYFPWTMYLFAPIGMLPFSAALTIWMTAMIVAVGATIRPLLTGLPSLASRSWPQRIFVAVLFFPFFKLLLFGNSTFVAFAAFYAATRLAERERWFAAGVALAFVSQKPHLLLPLEIALCIMALRKRQFGFFAGGALAVLFQFSVSLLLAPEIVRFYFERGAIWGRSQVAPTASLVRILSVHFDLPALATVVPLLGVCFGIYLGLRHTLHEKNIALILVPICLCITPYAWSHDFIFLFPAHFMLIAFALTRVGPTVVYCGVLAIFAASFYFLTQAGLEQYLFVYPFIYLALGLKLYKLVEATKF